MFPSAPPCRQGGISGTEGDPVLESATGDPLTAEEVVALIDLFDMIDDVFDLVDGLFSPFGGFSVWIGQG